MQILPRVGGCARVWVWATREALLCAIHNNQKLNKSIYAPVADFYSDSAVEINLEMLPYLFLNPPPPINQTPAACSTCVWTTARGGLASQRESASRASVYFGWMMTCIASTLMWIPPSPAVATPAQSPGNRTQIFTLGTLDVDIWTTPLGDCIFKRFLWSKVALNALLTSNHGTASKTWRAFSFRWKRDEIQKVTHVIPPYDWK